jgi:hypothetical protein
MITDNSNYVLTILKLDNTDNLYKLKYDYGMLSGGLWNVSLEIGEYALLESVNTKNCIYNHSEIDETTEHNIKFIITRKNSSKTF